MWASIVWIWFLLLASSVVLFHCSVSINRSLIVPLLRDSSQKEQPWGMFSFCFLFPIFNIIQPVTCFVWTSAVHLSCFFFYFNVFNLIVAVKLNLIYFLLWCVFCFFINAPLKHHFVLLTSHWLQKLLMRCFNDAVVFLSYILGAFTPYWDRTELPVKLWEKIGELVRLRSFESGIEPGSAWAHWCYILAE